MHHPVAMAAISRGKHVIVEKPMALSIARAREMQDAARAAGVTPDVVIDRMTNLSWCSG
jgi:predicted dehydrogenase